MKYLKRSVCVSIFLILLFPLISSQTVVQVPQEIPQSNFFTDAFAFMQSKVILSAFIIFAIVIALLILAFFVVKSLVKYIKDRNDIFWQLKRSRLKLASIQRRYPSKHWWKIKKNTPIRIVRREGQKLKISSPVAYHRGDYLTHEGNYIISMNLVGNNKWMFFPITDLLIIPNTTMLNIVTKGGKIETFENLPQADDIIQFTETDIFLFIESISNTGMFYIPVMKSSTGKVVDLSLPTYASLKRVILSDYLYEQTDEFSKLAKKSMDINPNLRYQMKVSDTSNTVEVPSGDNK